MVWIIGQHPFLKAEVRRKLVAVEILPLPVALRSAHRAERNRRAAYKINAVILLGTGWTLAEVSEALLLDDETLRSYVEGAFKASYAAALLVCFENFFLTRFGVPHGRVRGPVFAAVMAIVLLLPFRIRKGSKSTIAMTAANTGPRTLPCGTPKRVRKKFSKHTKSAAAYEALNAPSTYERKVSSSNNNASLTSAKVQPVPSRITAFIL